MLVDDEKGHFYTHLSRAVSRRIGQVAIHDIVASFLWPDGQVAAHSAVAESVPWAYRY